MPNANANKCLTVPNKTCPTQFEHLLAVVSCVPAPKLFAATVDLQFSNPGTVCQCQCQCQCQTQTCVFWSAVHQIQIHHYPQPDDLDLLGDGVCDEKFNCVAWFYDGSDCMEDGSPDPIPIPNPNPTSTTTTTAAAPPISTTILPLPPPPGSGSGSPGSDDNDDENDENEDDGPERDSDSDSDSGSVAEIYWLGFALAMLVLGSVLASFLLCCCCCCRWNWKFANGVRMFVRWQFPCFQTWKLGGVVVVGVVGGRGGRRDGGGVVAVSVCDCC